MKKTFLLFLVGTAALASYSRFSFFDVASDVLRETRMQLAQVGIQQYDPYDTRLVNDPRFGYPQIPVIEAYPNFYTGQMAYYDEELGGGANTLVFKDRQGGNRHRISFNEAQIEFVTPYAGRVAYANRWKTVSGWQYTFYCPVLAPTYPVAKYDWDNCIRSQWINVIRKQLTSVR